MDDIRTILALVAIVAIGTLAYNYFDLGAGKLDTAVEGGDIEIILREIDEEGDINASGSRGTLLHRAAKNGHFEIVEFLINKGADVNTRIEESFLGVLSKGYLSALGSDEGIDQAFGATPLHLAVFYGHENVVRLLLENGANPNLDLTVGSDWAPKYRRTTLQLAEKGGNEAILSLLTKPAE